MKEVIAYQCGFCFRVFPYSEYCQIHQNNCPMNPETLSCDTCAFFEQLPTCAGSKELGHHVCFAYMKILGIGGYSNCIKYVDSRFKDDTELLRHIVKDYDYKTLYEKAEDLTFRENMKEWIDEFDDDEDIFCW